MGRRQRFVTAEVWATGRVRRNRVKVRRLTDNTVRLEWFENGRQKCKYGIPKATEIKEKHKDLAREVARRLLPKHGTHQPPQVLVKMRADLLRVAQIEGRAEGVAPSQRGYTKLGAWSKFAISAAFKGYKKDTESPIESWSKAIQQFGLKTPNELRRRPYDRLVQDVLRVASLLGKPNEMPSRRDYCRVGKYAANTVIKYAGVSKWTDVADRIGLPVPADRFARAKRVVEWHANKRKALEAA